MGYTLILTEKPSAAQKMAEALAEGPAKTVNRRGISFYRLSRKGREIVVVPAVGHLFTLKDENGAGRSKWTYPVFSVKWMPTYLDKNSAWARKYYENIEELGKKADEFISATDFDVEGSVISYNIFRFLFRREDGKRMKFSTLTASDLVDAYEHASKHLDFPQIEAGLARHQLDYYFGINLTRALTIALEHSGGYSILSTGRVQGPTLKLLKDRSVEIENFRPVPYWELLLTGLVKGVNVSALHIGDKFWEKDIAEDILKKCKGKDGVVEGVEKKEHVHNPPVPFDLTTLQRDAYNLFGYSPKQTLDVAQSLYEQAAISYPRTSSQKLPPKIGYKAIISALAKQAEYNGLAQKLLSKASLKPREGPKTDPAHPAIFPTGVRPEKLGTYQKKLYDLIVKRFFAAFGEPGISELTRAVISVNGEKFIARGTRIVRRNWMELYAPYARMKEAILPELKEGDAVAVKKIDLSGKETQPPGRYTQASILREMENLGLGTKATRAGILQTLYDRGYIKDKSIVITELGKAVTIALEKNCPEIISVELTRQIEEGMEAIEGSKMKKEVILDRAKQDLKKILERFRANEKKIGSEILKAVIEYEKTKTTVGRCMKCGQADLRIIHSRKTGKRFVGCSGYPKCVNGLPLPQQGFISVTSKPCGTCGLFILSVKQVKRRPWTFCIKCGFTHKRPDKPAEAGAGQPKRAGAGKPDGKKYPAGQTAQEGKPPKRAARKKDAETARERVESGADIIVTGTIAEKVPRLLEG
ncbi:MAG: DNA topoisomerase I [Candidatus Aenigmarchaeota archaeon]|nr:DNA topoisomerase I [Candidatus Aenigmarchaeota archaeon]